MATVLCIFIEECKYCYLLIKRANQMELNCWAVGEWRISGGTFHRYFVSTVDASDQLTTKGLPILL